MKKPWNTKLYWRAKKGDADLFSKIQSAHESGQTKRAMYLTNQYLNLWGAKYVATVEAYKAMPRHHKVAGMDLEGITSRIDPFRGTDKPVTLHLKPKKSGDDYRHIMDFEIENRALQLLVLGALQAQTNLSPFQFGTKGGVAAACKEVLINLNGGFNHVLEIDITDCFPSVGVESLPDYLPIPKKVIDHVIISQSLNITPGNFIPFNGLNDKPGIEEYASGPYYDIIQEGRQGIPQGSATSCLVIEMLLAPVLSDLPKNVRVVTYIDNFLVMGKSEDDAASMKSFLEEFLTEHPAGPFAPRVESNSKPNDQFNFLGSEFFRKGGIYQCRPSGINLSEFSQRFDTGLDQIGSNKYSPGVRRRKAKNLQRFVRSWTSTFSLWEKSVAFRSKRLGDINFAAKDLLS